MDVAENAEKETARDTELEVALTVAEFNERQAIVETSRQALTIAEDAYAQTLQRFIRGQANAYDLSLAQSHWQTARQNQIASLQNYWLAYYHLRRLTHDPCCKGTTLFLISRPANRENPLTRNNSNLSCMSMTFYLLLLSVSESS